MGTFLWYFQRVSALIVLSYVLTIFFSYIFFDFSSYELWRNFITTPEIKLYTTIFLLISFSHGFQGLKAVEDDYLSERTLGFLSANIAKYSSLARLLYSITASLTFGLSYRTPKSGNTDNLEPSLLPFFKYFPVK